MTTHDDRNGHRDSGDSTSLAALQLADLARESVQELRRLIQGGDPGDTYTRELLRRAVTQHDAAAWASISRQYAPLIHAWLLLVPDVEPVLKRVGEGRLIEITCAQVMRSLTEEKLRSLGTHRDILKYLKMSVWSTAAMARRAEALQALISPGPLPTPADQYASPPDPDVAEALWQALLGDCHNETERLVVSLSYVLGMSPAEICRDYAQRFPTEEQVCLLQQEIIERVGQNQRLKALLL